MSDCPNCSPCAVCGESGGARDKENAALREALKDALETIEELTGEVAGVLDKIEKVLPGSGKALAIIQAQLAESRRLL